MTATQRRRAPRANAPTPTAPKPVATATQIQEKVVILIMTIRGPGNERRVRDKSILDTKADHNRLRVTKRLIEAKEHKAIQSIDIAIRAYVKRMALPSPFKEGVYALPLGLIQQVDNDLQGFAEERTKCVQALKLVFKQAIENARVALKDQFDETDYNIDLDLAYRLEWQYVSLAAPVQMQGSELYTREQARLQKQWDAAINDMRDALRVGLSELVNDLVKRLANSGDGEKRVKPSALLKRFEEFLGNFQARNVTGDEQLESLAEQARKLLKGVNTDTLIDSMDVRKQVEKGFKSVQKTLTTLETEAKTRRRITFTDE